MQKFYRVVLLAGLLVAAISGCQAVTPDASEVNSDSSVVTTTRSEITTSTLGEEEVTPQAPAETAVPQPTIAPSVTPTEAALMDFPPDIQCGEVFCQAPWTGLLARPIGSDGKQTIDPTYPYASTKNGTLEVHHGVEFPNGSGTPILAAQRGVVVYAGTDEATVLGPYPSFYGNVVILQHPRIYEGRDLYTLYAHLSVIEVSAGQPVDQGLELGRVGASGAADGSHLHFEVRLDENHYANTTNPILWFAPLNTPDTDQTGTVAGLLLARWGEPLEAFTLALEKVNTDGSVTKYFYPQTYDSAGINAHPALGENFAMADIPPGEYRLAFVSSSYYQVQFTLEPGYLGFINIQLD